MDQNKHLKINVDLIRDRVWNKMQMKKKLELFKIVKELLKKKKKKKFHPKVKIARLHSIQIHFLVWLLKKMIDIAF